MALHIKTDAEETTTILVRFIRDQAAAAGVRDVVLGLSGGLDSAVVAALSARAIGPEHVHAYALPSQGSDPDDLGHARAVADRFKLKLREIPIGAIAAAAGQALGSADTRAVANLTARARMMVLYAEAQRLGALVIGTGNKSELLTGYFTKHGDGGVDLAPIGDLYKTQVRELAAYLDVPREVVAKPPSAGLWPGQTDEGELGIDYVTLDQVLLGLEIGLPLERIATDAKTSLDEVRRIEAMRRRTQHKRTPPLVCKLGIRSLTSDWRDPATGTGAP